MHDDAASRIHLRFRKKVLGKASHRPEGEQVDRRFTLMAGPADPARRPPQGVARRSKRIWRSLGERFGDLVPGLRPQLRDT